MKWYICHSNGEQVNENCLQMYQAFVICKYLFIEHSSLCFSSMSLIETGGKRGLQDQH